MMTAEQMVNFFKKNLVHLAFYCLRFANHHLSFPIISKYVSALGPCPRVLKKARVNAWKDLIKCGYTTNYLHVQINTHRNRDNKSR